MSDIPYWQQRRDLKNGAKTSPEAATKPNLADLPKSDDNAAKKPVPGKGLKKPQKPINRASKKRAKQLRAYSPLQKKFMRENPVCEAQLENCTGIASEVNHAAGRAGKQLLKVEDFRGLCHSCHKTITNQDKEARQKGLVKSRLGKMQK